MYIEPDISKEQKLETAKNLANTLDMTVSEVLEAMDVGLDEHGNTVPRKQPPIIRRASKTN